MAASSIDYGKSPPALRYMAGAFLPSPGLRPGEAFPALRARWHDFILTPAMVRRFKEATGLDEGSVLFPHAACFRLLMAVLTSRQFPLPIWNALQIRNEMTGWRPLTPGESYEVETTVGEHRVVDKGLEVDLCTRITNHGRCDWQSTVTFFYRGRVGEANATPPAAPELGDASTIARFRMPSGGGRSFGVLTGDYNGLHLWTPYARRFGFPAAFLHPQASAGLCLARLDLPGDYPQSVSLWIRGPVFYGAEVALVAAASDHGRSFGLSLAGDPRFALMGSWCVR